MKIGLKELAEILGINHFTLYGMIQAGIITRYEDTPQKRQRYLFSEEDAVAALIIYELMSLGIGRKQASEIGNAIMIKTFKAKTGLEISANIEKYHKLIAKKFIETPS